MSSSDDESDHPVSEAEEAFQKRQMAVVKRLNAVGCAFIRGVDEDVEPPYSEEDVAAMRIVVVTKARAKAFAAAQNFAAGQEIDDDDCGFLMFDTSTGNAVVSGIADEVKKAVAKKSKSAKFDELLALTYALNDNDMWARDNELWGDGDARSSAPPGRSSSAKARTPSLASTRSSLGRGRRLCSRTSGRFLRTPPLTRGSRTRSSGSREATGEFRVHARPDETRRDETRPDETRRDETRRDETR